MGGKFEKGRKKTGGRVKGTPNKTTTIIKQHFLQEVCEYVESGLFHQDICNINDYSKRLDLVLKITHYLLPKQQSVAADINVTDEAQQSVIDKLRQLAQDNE